MQAVLMAFVLILMVAVAALVEAVIVARVELLRLRSIVDQWTEEQHAETDSDTDEAYASGWAKMK